MLRRISFLLILFTSLSLSGRTFRHEFGAIREDGGVVSYTFSLPVAGSKPLSVVGAMSGCPCMKVDIPKRPVAPGSSLKVTVSYDPERQQGHFTKSVYLRLSGGLRDTLMVTGTVTHLRERYDKRAYPADFGLGLRLDRRTIDAGTVHPGSTRRVEVPLINSFEAGMSLDFRVEGRDRAMVTVPYGLCLKPVAKSKIIVIFTVPTDAARSKLNARLIPMVNGIEADPIPVTARIR